MLWFYDFRRCFVAVLDAVCVGFKFSSVGAGAPLG